MCKLLELKEFTSEFVPGTRTKGVAVIKQGTSDIVYCNSIATIAHTFCVSEQTIYACINHKGIDTFKYKGEKYYLCYATDKEMLRFFTQPITIYPASYIQMYTEPAYK